MGRKAQDTRHKVQGQFEAPLDSCALHSCALCLVPCTLYPIFARMKILMVCLGNICRSPLAEGILQHKATAAGLNWVVDSAGTNGYHTGEPPHHLSIKAGLQNGIDIRQQKSRQFIAADFDRYDKIYAMAEDVIDDIKKIAKTKFDTKKIDLLLNELFPEQNLEVPDPWYGPEKGYHEVYELLDKVCEMIVRRELSMVSSET